MNWLKKLLISLINILKEKEPVTINNKKCCNGDCKQGRTCPLREVV